jgi:DNA-binding NarL/FixJ family response regulator
VDTRKTLARLTIAGLLSAIFLLPPAFSQESPTKRKVSQRVVPEYPTLARQMNITGKVKIEVTVAPDVRQHPEARIVMVSSVGYQDNILAALQKGARHFVQKPVTPNVLYEIIRYVLNDDGVPAPAGVGEAQS